MRTVLGMGVKWALVLCSVTVWVGTGCIAPEKTLTTAADRESRPLRLAVETAPAGASVVVSGQDPGTARTLGRGPVAVEGLAIVTRRYPSGRVDHWLEDAGGKLPPNLAKPPHASARYVAGSDYPLELRFAAALAGHEPVVATVKVDRALLEKLAAEGPSPTLKVRLDLTATGGSKGTPGER